MITIALRAVITVVLGSGIVWGTCFASAAEAPAPLADVLLAIPGDLDWQVNLYDEDRDALRELLETPRVDVLAMLQSDNGFVVGAAIFWAHSKGDLELLWSLRHLVDDQRPTIPRAVLGDASGVSRARQEQTVGSYLSEVLGVWLGLSPVSGTDLERHFAGVGSPWQLVQPWVVRMRYAREGRSGESPAEIQERIAGLPSELRWAIVAWSNQAGYLTKMEAREALNESTEFLDRAREGTLSVPSDPIIATSHKLQTLRRAYIELMTGPSEE